MSEAKAAQNNEEINIFEEILDWIEAILFSVFIAVTFFTFILKPAEVDGPSMLPTLHDGDKILTSSMFYNPKAGDIVTLNCTALNESIVKRVIATEGQTVDIDFEAGKVYVDGEEQYEPFINDITTRDLGAFEYPVTVPENCVFVMGDNRNNSTDSRSPYVGFVNKEDIWGRAVFRVYPFDSFGKL